MPRADARPRPRARRDARRRARRGNRSGAHRSRPGDAGRDDDALEANGDGLASFGRRMRWCRAIGIASFDRAWALSVPRSAPDRERAAVRAALDATRDRWLAAWDGQPQTESERVLATIPALVEDDGDATAELPHGAM